MKSEKSLTKVCNTSDREVEYCRANRSFQVARDKIQDNKTESKKRTTKKAKQKYGPCRTK